MKIRHTFDTKFDILWFMTYTFRMGEKELCELKMHF